MIRLFLIISLLTSCNINETNREKEIKKLVIDEKLQKLLQEDVSDYINNYRELYEDSLFVLIVQKKNDINHLRFYATNGIIDTFQYIGYFYCDNVLFLYRDTGMNEENSLSLVSKSKNNDVKTFSTIPLKPVSDVPFPDDPYLIHYTYKDDSLERVTD